MNKQKNHCVCNTCHKIDWNSLYWSKRQMNEEEIVEYTSKDISEMFEKLLTMDEDDEDLIILRIEGKESTKSCNSCKCITELLTFVSKEISSFSCIKPITT